MGHHEKNGKSDEWYTPKYIFDALGCTFETDAAAPVDRKHCNVPAIKFITENSLNERWLGFTWLNPPFGGRNGISPWLDKMADHGDGIALSPDRTSTSWWQKAATECDLLMQVHHKIKFIDHNGNIGTKPGNGTTLFAYGEEAMQALINASNKGLGILFKQV